MYTPEMLAEEMFDHGLPWAAVAAGSETVGYASVNPGAACNIRPSGESFGHENRTS